MPAFVPLRSVQEVVLPAVCPSPHRLRAARYELRRCSGALDYQKAVAVRIAEVEHGWHATSEPHGLQISVDAAGSKVFLRAASLIFRCLHRAASSARLTRSDRDPITGRVGDVCPADALFLALFRRVDDRTSVRDNKVARSFEVVDFEAEAHLLPGGQT